MDERYEIVEYLEYMAQAAPDTLGAQCCEAAAKLINELRAEIEEYKRSA